uniref:Uncharacterized protein n=1 Tax=Lepeophtheirus salmonis TaxID=72036 RepID=A0A0K2TEX6_LEPSM
MGSLGVLKREIVVGCTYLLVRVIILVRIQKRTRRKEELLMASLIK